MREICDALRATRCAPRATRTARGWPYAHDTLPSGMQLDRCCAALYREGVESGELPRLDLHAGRRGGLRRLADRGLRAEAPGGVTRYLYAVWADRGGSAARLSRTSATADPTASSAGAASTARARSALAELLPPRRRRAAAPTAAAAAARRPTPPRTSAPFGVNVAGYLRAELGRRRGRRQMLDGARRRRRARAAGRPRSRRTAARGTTFAGARCTSATRSPST